MKAFLKVCCSILPLAALAGLVSFVACHCPRHRCILCLGDSITAGCPGYVAGAPAGQQGDVRSQYEYWLQARLPGWQVINRGIPGECTARLCARLPQELAAARPGYVVILEGTNDVGHGIPPADTLANLDTILRQVQAAGARPVVCLLTPAKESTSHRPAAAIRALNSRLAALAAARRVCLIDTYTSMAADPQHPAAMPRAFSNDGLHPNACGYQHLAEVIAAQAPF